MKYNVGRLLVRDNRKLDSRYSCSEFTLQFLCSTALLPKVHPSGLLSYVRTPRYDKQTVVRSRVA